ncbi:MAG TPA: SpoIIE family protein phosphatase [Ignavibacteriaceae bacterium]|nr:SpoIIE family protein phosphatase [Ignavibacteriaceae bacterium]
MAYNRFRVQVAVRSFLLGLFIFLFYYLLDNKLIVSSILVLFLFFAQIYLLIHYVEKTNRDISRFLNSIKFSDFSQSFTEKNLGPSFKELQNSFNSVMEQFKTTRSEMEENFQYLQTTVKHINTGLVCFKENGEIELFNDAAKKLLGIKELTNINSLSSTHPILVKELITIEGGEKCLVKINLPRGKEGSEEKNVQLALAAAKFKMRGKKFTLVSLQDITNELERERLKNEMEIAREVQFKLFPKKDPVIPGYLIASKCLPALEVWGDYFDFIHLDDQRLGIVIGDVSGKGLPAAIYMTLTKGVFQSYAASSDSSKEVLTKLNSLIYRTIERGNFITMFYAILDFKNHKLQYSRAGHEPVISFNADKSRFSLLRPNGIGLGLEKGKIFSDSIEEMEIQISPGDSFLFYTDGLTDFGIPLLSKKDEGSSGIKTDIINIIKHNNSVHPAKLLDKISEEISAVNKNAYQYDDMTMIAVNKINNE